MRRRARAGGGGGGVLLIMAYTVFCDRDLGNRAGNFSHMNTPARLPGLSGTKYFQLRIPFKVADKSNAGPRVFWGPFGHFSFR